jgi:hypothetical protein
MVKNKDLTLESCFGVNMGKLLRLVPLLLVSGCMSTFHTQPYVTYADVQHPQSDTSVFSSSGLNGNTLGQIVAVDGVKTSCWKVGCPIWVRVLPGDHVFTVTYNIFDNGIASHKTGTTDLRVTAMQPRHLYEVLYQIVGDRFRGFAEDLGEDPDYGIYVGLQGVNQKRYRASFK